MSDTPTPTAPNAFEWADLDLYNRCLSEGMKARDHWSKVPSDCPYPRNSVAWTAWIDGYNAR